MKLKPEKVPVVAVTGTVEMKRVTRDKVARALHAAFVAAGLVVDLKKHSLHVWLTKAQQEADERRGGEIDSFSGIVLVHVRSRTLFNGDAKDADSVQVAPGRWRSGNGTRTFKRRSDGSFNGDKIIEYVRALGGRIVSGEDRSKRRRASVETNKSIEEEETKAIKTEFEPLFAGSSAHVHRRVTDGGTPEEVPDGTVGVYEFTLRMTLPTLEAARPVLAALKRVVAEYGPRKK